MPATVAFAYAGSVDRHTDLGLYDPSLYAYLDGASGTDPWLQPVRWAGTADNSVSEVVPKLPAGWQYEVSTDAYNLHVLETSRMVWTTNPTGRIGAMLRIDQGDTATVRTLGLSTQVLGPDGLPAAARFVSGEISLNLRDTSTVEVQVYGAPDDTASGTLLATQSVPTQGAGEWHDIPITDPYVYLQLVYTESGFPSGYPVQMDNVLILPTYDALGADYPGYFDGSTADGGWDGGSGSSTSTYFGGGRRCLAEVIEAIDMTSLAGGTRAEFAVAMVVPGAFWEDLILNTVTFAVDNTSLLTPAPTSDDLPGLAVSLEQLSGGTAPIDDATIVLQASGTVTGLTITDVATGAWLSIAGNLPTTGTIEINNAAFTVRNYTIPKTFTSLIASVTRGGSNQLLPVTPLSSVVPPAMQFSATGNGSLSVTLIARRRYVIA